jgi:eukaryotic-like serine/threonine-protein kinase
MHSLSLIGNRYKILEPAGHGGMADVYLARDLMLERRVAVKILKHDFSVDESFQSSFLFEARAAANLAHTNIVTIYDFGFESGQPYIVMEYIDGVDFKSLIQERGKIPQAEALPLIIQACAGIGYAHRAGLIHCDIKPHNLIITPDRRLKITDFGIARALSTINPGEVSEIVWGSPLYFSPEQASGLAPSPASDVYSLGVVLYESLTGQTPFYSSDPSELARMHREQPPTTPRTLVPEIMPSLEKIMLKVLSKDPSARYRNGDQFGRVLNTFCKQNQIPVPYSAYEDGKNIGNEVETDYSVDWITIGLSFAALFLVGGLIPFWIYIFLRFGNFF